MASVASELGHTRPAPTRIGWLEDWDGYLPLEKGVSSLCRKALDCWSNSDASTSSILVTNVKDKLKLFPFDNLWDAYNSVRFSATLEKYEEFDVRDLIAQRGSLIKEELAWELEQGKLVTEQDLVLAREVHRSFDEWIEKAMSEFDVLALPSVQVWPFSINCRYPKSIGEKRMETYHQWMQVCAPVSFAGLPCVTIPAGFSETGLPMGIQLFGRRGNDMLLLSLASKYDCATKGTRQTVSYIRGEDAVLTTR